MSKPTTHPFIPVGSDLPGSYEETLAKHSELAAIFGKENLHVEMIAGDGSERSYYRIRDTEKKSVSLAMRITDLDNLKLLKNSYDWSIIREVLQKACLRVPNIFGHIKSLNAVIIEDFGDMTIFEYSAHASREKLAKIYGKCLEAIVSLLSVEPTPGAVWTSRAFNKQKLMKELDFFKTHYLENARGLFLNKNQSLVFNEECASLSTFLAQYACYFTHRDFHSKNILLIDGDVGIIDFQDAMLGSPTYDLVSLVFDPYVKLSFIERKQLYEKFLEKIMDPKLKAQVKESFIPTALQRLYKILGSFGYLELTMNRGSYLKHADEVLSILNQLVETETKWPFLTRTLPRLIYGT